MIQEIGNRFFKQFFLFLNALCSGVSFKVQSPELWFDFSISPTVGGCELGGLRSSSPSQGQVLRGAAEVNLDLTRGT